MSQINDALKRIQKISPDKLPGSLPPLQPVANPSPSVTARLIPAIVIVLVVAAIFFIGWAVAYQPVHSIAATSVIAPAPIRATQPVEVVVATVAAPAPVPPPPVVPALPKLQGIFYSTTAPSAIVDGKTVRPGDPFKQYRVKAITQLTVSLMDAEGKTTTLVMGN